MGENAVVLRVRNYVLCCQTGGVADTFLLQNLVFDLVAFSGLFCLSFFYSFFPLFFQRWVGL